MTAGYPFIVCPPPRVQKSAKIMEGGITGQHCGVESSHS